MTDEEWKPVADYEGLYWVSDKGRVKSRRKILKPFNHPQGYVQVGLSMGGTIIKFYVHHLVSEAFIGERPNGLVTNHIDGDRKNNSVKNLEYVTHRENVCHGSKNHHTGVRKKGNSYQAYSWVDGRQHHIGTFSTKSQARKAFLGFLEINGIQNKYA